MTSSTIRALAVLICVTLLSGLPAAVADNRPVTLATLNWAPYYAEDLPRQGFFSALVRAAFERRGYDLQIDFIPWARAMKDAREGYRDGLHGAYYSEERTRDFWVSDPIYDVDVGLIARRDAGISSYRRIADLQPFTIGVGRGFAHSEEFDAAMEAGRLRIEAEEDQLLNIRKLYAGRIDMMADSLDLFRYEAQRQGHSLDEVVFVEPPLVRNQLHIMISRTIDDGDRIIRDFNAGLAEIRADGSYDRILEEMGFR